MTFKKGHKINKGRVAWNKGLHHTDRQKKKQSIAMKGKFSGNKHPKYSHGMCGTRPYKLWGGIKRRCFNKNDISYCKYGAKGITMCDDWKDSFEIFWKDMKDTYFDEAQIDRLDNSRGYFKGNCRWATLKEQANNKCSVNMYTFNGKTMNTVDWAKEIGINSGTLRARLVKYNWSLKDALTRNINYANRFKK